ncbi:13828_t:CDS:2 [Gigaspora rosea]|nr:13828_t:CDS:2 [Gigaspora rosea]
MTQSSSKLISLLVLVARFISSPVSAIFELLWVSEHKGLLFKTCLTSNFIAFNSGEQLEIEIKQC